MEERRQETSVLLLLVQTVHDDVKALKFRLNKHMDDEEDELSVLRVHIDNNKQQSEDRHIALMQSITSYMDKSIKLEEAFLKDHKGEPDIRGHFEDHSYRKAFMDWIGEARNRALMKATEYGILAFLAWIAYEAWIALLKGPK